MNKYQLHDVFLSYRRFEDEARKDDQGTRIAESIYRYLESKGLKVFWDQPEMETGSFVDQLQWQLEHCPNYIFIGTESARHFRPVTPPERDYVAEEVRYALHRLEEEKNLPNRSRDRVVLHIMPQKSKTQKEMEKNGLYVSPEPYPAEILDLLNTQQGVALSDDLPTEKELALILKYVTTVNRGNLWNAGERWLEQMTKPGSRFASLSIDRTIMPLAAPVQKENDFLPIRAHLEEKQDAPLMDMIARTKGHLYLIGEGGIGKTTALFSIMKKVYGPGRNEADISRNRMNGQVPLFVELSKAPDTYGRLYEGGRSTFIQRAVYQLLRQELKVKQVSSASVQDIQEVFRLPYDTAVRPIHDLFTQETPSPEYLLLLDGLNEVSRSEIRYAVKEGDGSDRTGRSAVVSMVLREIKQLMEECPNVRIILTSRSKEETTWGNRTTMLYLSGLRDEVIQSYLRSRNVPGPRIASALQNEKLKEVLRIPLFLTMYASLEGNDELLTRGEILRLFFHQKKEKLYTAKARTEAVDRDVDQAASAAQPDRLTADMQSFILDFILPEIAWRMEKDGEFYLRLRGRGGKEGLHKIIWRVLTDQSETAVCGENGRYEFSNYRRGSGKNSTLRTARKLCERLQSGAADEGFDQDEIVGGVLDCAVMNLGILQKYVKEGEQEEYGFVHHHIQEYFAAAHQINCLRMALSLQENGDNEGARACLAEWEKAPLNAEVRRLIGEALGEAHNAPTCDENGHWHYAVPEEPCPRNALKRALDIYRGRFGHEDGYAVWNVIEILKAVRQDLSGEDFSALDLENCNVNGFSLGKKNCPARLFRARISDSFVMPGGHTNFVNMISFHPQGKAILTASSDHTVKIWDVGTMQVIETLTETESVGFASYSPDGKKIVTSSCGSVKVWDASSGRMIHVLTKQNQTISSAVFSPDGSLILTGSGDGTATVWDAENYKTTAVLTGHVGWINSCAFSPDGRKIATASSDKTVRIWDTQTRQTAAILTGHAKSVRSAAFSPNGRRIITASDDTTVKIWDAETYQELFSLTGHSKFVTSACYSPNGRLIATVSGDNTIRIWDARSLAEIGVFTKHVINISSAIVLNTAAFSPDGNLIVTSFGDRSATLWDTRTLNEVGTLAGHVGWVSAAVFSPDGSRVVLSTDMTCKIWDKRTGRICGILKGHRDGVNYSVVSPSGNEIATASYDCTVKLWDAVTLCPFGTLTGHKGSVYCAVYSAKEDKLVTASSDRTIRVWNLRTMEEIGVLGEETDPVASILFSPDDRSIVTFFSNGTAKMWDAETLTEIGVLKGQTGQTDYAPTGPNGWKLLIARGGKHVDLWNPRTKKTIKRLAGHDDWIVSAVFSPDSQFILTASSDGTAKIWSVHSFRCLETIHSIPGMEVIGVDFRHLHPESQLSGEVKERLYEYGAIVDERG